MKKICFLFILFVCFAVNVDASSYYVNKNGAKLTESQYDYLLNYFSDTYLDELSVEGIEELKKWDNVYSVEDEKQKVLDIVKTIMESVVDQEVPLKVSQDFGKDLYETK